MIHPRCRLWALVMLPDGWRATKHAQHGVWEKTKTRSQSERDEKRRRASERASEARVYARTS